MTGVLHSSFVLALGVWIRGVDLTFTRDVSMPPRGVDDACFRQRMQTPL